MVHGVPRAGAHHTHIALWLELGENPGITAAGMKEGRKGEPVCASDKDLMAIGSLTI